MKTYNDTFSEMTINYGELKRCKKIYNIISIFYVLFGLIYVSESFDAISNSSTSPLPILLDGIIFKVATVVFGYGACYKHKSIYSLFTIIISFCSIIMAACDSGFVTFTGFRVLYFALLFLCIFAGVVIIFTNKKYKYLEEQPGFPYFNEKFEEKKFDAVQTNKKSEYQQNCEKRMETAVNETENLNAAPTVGNNHGYGKMDEI